MLTQQPLDEKNLRQAAASLVERHHPLSVILAVWWAARNRRRQMRREAAELGHLNLSNRMRRDMGLPETEARLPGVPLDIFNIRF